MAVVGALVCAGLGAQPVPASAPGSASAARPIPLALTAPVPRVSGRLRATDLGLVINTRDPYSVAIGAHYARRRGLRPDQILRVELPQRSTLTRTEFDLLSDAITKRFGRRIQALALAWSEPYAVNCNSITGAIALGYDEALCRQTCAATRPSPYANARSTRPFTDFGVRPSMLLAAHDIDAGRAMIDRGVRSDRSLGRRGGLPVSAVFVSTSDVARNVRDRLYPPAGTFHALGLTVHRTDDLAADARERVVLIQTGAAQVTALGGIGWVAGALADHLTSYGGQLSGTHGQTTANDWIAAGATASHGTVSEPCNHLQKFPHPQWLLLHYLQGSTAIEAYWKSVLWPQQSLFVGEPLAAPFARR